MLSQTERYVAIYESASSLWSTCACVTFGNRKSEFWIQQQQQVYFMLITTYKTCARN